MNFYLNLFYIALITTLVELSGFWENLDEWVNKKFRFHHLPYILRCTLCQTTWLCLLYMCCVGEVSILNIAVCLMMAHSTELIQPMIRLIIEIVKKIIYNISRQFL